MNGTVSVIINGERKEIPEGLSVAAMLEHLKLASNRVAIERNLDILPRGEWEKSTVQPNDRFEIVHFVGGG